MDEQKGGHVNNLFEDSWFFGNTLLSNKSRSYSSKMVRSYSDPCTSSSTKEEILVSQLDPSKTSNLLRTPSLPPCFGRETKFEGEEEEEEEEKEEEDETRMGDLIRQAMPMPMLMNGRRLDRAPSLPPCRGKEFVNMVSNIHSGPNSVGRLTRRASIDSSVLLPEKGPIGMAKLSRRASIDSSMVLPPKYMTSKGTKQSTTSNSKNRPQRKQEPTETRSQNLDKSKSQKSLSDLEIKELQGFKDLGFSFDNKQVSPSVAQILPALQRKGTIDSSFNNNRHLNKVVRRPYLSESWERPSPSASALAPPVIKRVDQKPPSAEDMKAHIKFWARAVASNVRQEC